uniref:Uncharacterized protein n=1 Tax=Sphingomonas sp. JE1 TaxID=1628059 RepID=A0A0D4ZZT4_9SPHN|nr:hypothetical protein pJE1_217 [Sphingomonas sp. JE1]
MPTPEALQLEQGEEAKPPRPATNVAIGNGPAAIVATLLYARRR